MKKVAISLLVSLLIFSLKQKRLSFQTAFLFIYNYLKIVCFLSGPTDTILIGI